ncbi:hypothetical protein OU798_11810 [Prolixibacteraceae bacterium Z1-6]|uniref:Uncharacterized protein n=1 Tax=Draconibacterium aestuarii TaxID=2998507 RepID=A0A9X3J6J8_9BACT|nr:hypothetical protein [Prolixibacteraceae bacterium Z1-6]
MSYLTEAKKRDFVSQMAVLSEENFNLIAEHGFNPTDRITTLKETLKEARDAEGEQLKAAVGLKDATIKSQEKLTIAYKEASKTVELFAGLLGKDHPLIKQIRKMRK